MKKVHMFVFLIMLNTATYASYGNAENASTSSETVYCPESVTCTRAGDGRSCTFQSDHPEYWINNIGTPGYDANVTIGTHKLDFVIAYKSSKTFHMSYCFYSTATLPQNTTWINIAVQKLANIEAPNNNSNWKFSGDDGFGRCDSSNPKLCPLAKHQALIIQNKNIHDGVSAISNGVRLDVSVKENQYAKILYDDVLVGCGLSDICKIDIASAKGAIYGYVYIDMNNKMNILSVHSWRPSEINISQIDGFNAVEISYSDAMKKY